MKGFFYQEEKKKPSAIKEKKAGGKSGVKKTTKEKNLGCESCGLYKKCESPRLKVSGQGKKKILLIGEAPGKTEDYSGVIFSGEMGNGLNKIARELGLSIDRDCWKTHAIICRPDSSTGFPTSQQVACCRKRLHKLIQELAPKKIITFGLQALNGVIGDRETINDMEKWAGHIIPDRVHECFIIPNYNPLWFISNTRDNALRNRFKRILSTAFDYKETFPEYEDEKKFIEIVKSPEPATIFLQSLMPGMYTTIDIETTGLKPYASGHKIKCISIAISETRCVVFPIFEDNKDFIKALKKFLRNKEIKKIAHNFKFEAVWLKVILGAHINGWYWDTMLSTHILDNRTGVSGLKFQSYVQFGVGGYDDEVAPYLKAKDANGFNRIDECPIDNLLLYCGMDALLEHRLYLKHIKEMDEKDCASFDLLFKGTNAFIDTEINGIKIDTDYFKGQSEHLNKRIAKMNKKLNDTEEVQKWNSLAKKGKPYNQEFNYSSSLHLKAMLFQVMKLNPSKQTAKGNDSTDAEVLNKIDLPFTNYITNIRKMEKILSTYIDGFLSEATDGFLHPSFALNLVKTYRSSSSNPNFQNIPKRDKEAQRTVRSGIIPRPGRLLGEADYSGVEVRISACYHKDPSMIQYIEDPTTDMHRDQAMVLFKMEKEEVTKELRHLSKNKFVFPQFYGDYYKNCATNIWQELQEEEKKLLKKKGLSSYNSFENHVKKAEAFFWNERFPVYTKWKDQVWNQYQRQGYIESLTNFRYKGLMNKKEVTNYPIQGSAFHCLLWSYHRMQEYLIDNKMDTMLIGQIHDSMIFDFAPDEVEHLKPIIYKTMIQDIKKDFKWIIVPLDVEMELGKINGSWHEMEKTELKLN